MCVSAVSAYAARDVFFFFCMVCCVTRPTCIRIRGDDDHAIQGTPIVRQEPGCEVRGATTPAATVAADNCDRAVMIASASASASASAAATAVAAVHDQYCGPIAAVVLDVGGVGLVAFAFVLLALGIAGR